MTANEDESQRTATSGVAESGKLEGMDLDRAVRLVSAVDALVVDPLARPVVRELRKLLEEARGEVASVTDLNAERAKRDRER